MDGVRTRHVSCQQPSETWQDISGVGANVPVYGGGFSYAYRLEHLPLNRSRAVPCRSLRIWSPMYRAWQSTGHQHQGHQLAGLKSQATPALFAPVNLVSATVVVYGLSMFECGCIRQIRNLT